MSQNPATPLYWIASYPHSGDQLVRSFLQHLSKSFGYRPQDGAALELLDRDLPCDVQAHFYETVVGKHPRDMSEEEIAAARPKIHEHISQNYPGLPVVKTHAPRAEFYGFPSINPKVSVGSVYLIRNPLVLASAFAIAGKKDITSALNLLATSEYRQPTSDTHALEPWGSWSQNVASWTAQTVDGDLVVRFEDIIADPTGQLGRVAKHLKMPVDDKQIKSAADAALKAHGIKGRSIPKSAWKAGLKNDYARALVEIHALQMSRFGYLTNDVLNYVGMTREVALNSSAKFEELSRKPVSPVGNA
ncbi:sulfotransferase domain-containing protein [Maritalea sp.]|uniref:sulfotransferase domain-containing protein n=1 Tax=Maritalea sp. TaxID=2003361 RepID=UPI003EF6440D